MHALAQATGDLPAAVLGPLGALVIMAVVLWSLARAYMSKDHELRDARDATEKRLTEHIAELRRVEEANRKTLDEFAKAITTSRRVFDAGDEGDQANR